MTIIGHIGQPETFLGLLTVTFVIRSGNHCSTTVTNVNIRINCQALTGRATGSERHVTVQRKIVGGIDAERQQQFCAPLQWRIITANAHPINTVTGLKPLKANSQTVIESGSTLNTVTGNVHGDIALPPGLKAADNHPVAVLGIAQIRKP